MSPGPAVNPMARYEHQKEEAEPSWGERCRSLSSDRISGRALRGDLLKGKLAHIGLLGGVLNRHADETPVVVQFDEDVVVQVARLGDALVAQRDEQRIRIGKVTDFHVPDPLKERSKKALCTVSPSGNRPRASTAPPLPQSEPTGECGRLLAPAPVPGYASHAQSIRDGLFFGLHVDGRPRNTANISSLTVTIHEPSTVVEQPALSSSPPTGHVSWRTYHPSRSVCFVVKQSKFRENLAADFRDRVVHHVLVDVLERVWEPIFLHDS